MREVLLGIASIVLISMPVFGQAATQASAAATRKLYVDQCAKCHGANGVPRPIAKGARRFIDPTWSPSIEQVQEAIITGKGEEMPRFKAKLSATQIQSLAEYVLGFKNRGTSSK